MTQYWHNVDYVDNAQFSKKDTFHLTSSGRTTVSSRPTLDDRQLLFVQPWIKDSSFCPTFHLGFALKHVCTSLWWFSLPLPVFFFFVSSDCHPHCRMYFAWFDRSVIIIVELGQSYHHEDHPDQMLGILEGCLKCQYLRLAASTSYKCIHTALTSRWNIIPTRQLHTSQSHRFAK